jgi:hypothetical protein
VVELIERAEIGLQGSGINALIGQCVAAGMPEHVGMDLEADLSFVTGAGEQLGETRWGERPQRSQHKSTDDFPGLVRAADLIGQLADINYLRKQPALFNEFRETGTSEKLGYKSVEDLRVDYPHFFRKMVRPYIGDALRYLQITQEGKQWASNLYANVFSREHRGRTPGP